MRTLVLLAATVLALLLAAPRAEVAEDDVFTDDFSREVEGRWQAIHGEWAVSDGRMVQSDASDYSYRYALADFPFTEGTVEVVAVARKPNNLGFAAIGLVLRYADAKHYLVFRYGAYGGMGLEGKAPGDWGGVSFGAATVKIGRPYRLKAIMRNGLIGLSVDGVMVSIVHDPLQDEDGPMAGRPGVYAEAHVEFDDFRVVRTSR